jgi:hypothetical protein
VVVAADVTQVRINAGESYALGYQVEVDNVGGAQTAVRLSDKRPLRAGIALSSDNQGDYLVLPGRNRISITRVIIARQPGRYKVALGVTVTGQQVEEKAAVTVVVTADGDRDGVADDLDRCPEFTAGAIVGPNGCAPQEQQSADLVTIQLGSGPNALILRTFSANVGSDYWTENGVRGFNVKGTLLIASPLGDIPMYEADVLFDPMQHQGLIILSKKERSGDG